MPILSDWELWACANEQLKQHGENASIFAAMRADELLEAGDQDGVHNWLLIIDRIEQLMARNEGALH
jgi:ribosome assembly protein YihI (activator of Der GTPase)